MIDGAVKKVIFSRGFEENSSSKSLGLAYGLAMAEEPCLLGPLLFLRAGSLRHI